MELADCVEGTELPVWLSRLMQSAESLPQDTASLLSALVVLAVEMGFVPIADQTHCPRPSAPVGYSWPKLLQLTTHRLLDLYTPGPSHIVTLSLPSCEHTLDLVVSPLGDLFIVNFHIPSHSETWALTLSSTDYFSFNNRVPKLEKLPELSLKFKSVCSVARNEILELSGFPEYNLTGLPYEMLCLICTYLNAESFAMLTATCRKLNFLYYDKKLWKKWHKIEFPNDCESENSLGRERFIEKYKVKRRSRRAPFPPFLYPYPYFNSDNIDAIFQPLSNEYLNLAYIGYPF